jgi:A/G-specific adenine glycosylase
MRRVRAAVPHHQLAVAVIRKGGRVLLVQRPTDELLGGLWMFPTVRVENGSAPSASLRRGLRAELSLAVSIQTETQTISHAYTHFKVTATVYNCQWKSGQPKRNKRVKWATLSSLTSYPMGKVDRRVAQSLWP